MEPSPCTPPHKSFPMTQRTRSEASQFNGSHNYKTKQTTFLHRQIISDMKFMQENAIISIEKSKSLVDSCSSFSNRLTICICVICNKRTCYNFTHNVKRNTKDMLWFHKVKVQMTKQTHRTNIKFYNEVHTKDPN